MSISLRSASIRVASFCALGPPLIATGILAAVEFTVGGDAYGSVAAAWMSSIGIIPAGSLFAILQSIDTLGNVGFVFSPPAIAFEVSVFSSVMCAMEKHSVQVQAAINTAIVNTADFVSNAKRDITIFFYKSFANLSDVTRNLHSNLETTGNRSSAINHTCLEFISRHFKDGITVIDEKARTYR